MVGVNKVILIGNLGADPESRQTQGGGSVCNLRVATTERWSDREGQKQERTEWHSVVVWGRQAENCQRYLSKGSPVYVEGRLQSRKYTDQSGAERTVWDVNASTVQFLSAGDGGGRRGGGDTGGGGWSGSTGAAGGWSQGGKPKASAGGSWGGGAGGGGGSWDDGGDDGDDPIPF